MADAVGTFALLTELAKEDSSEKRRELLRKVTDTFFNASERRSEREGQLFDEIVGAVAADLETQVRIELARKVAASNLPVRPTARRLAMDVIDVARPVIERSTALTQGDLIDVIQETTQDHMMAVTQRPDIGEKVASALVAKGSDHVVASLLKNVSARLNRETFERVAGRATSSPVLHAPFIRHKQVPLDLLNAVYLKVSANLRREIIGKFQGATAADIEAALAASCDHLFAAYGALPIDYQLAKEHVDDLVKRDALRPSSLEALLRENKRTSFLIAFARLVDVNFDLASRLVEARDLDALAILCRSADFDQNVFTTLCMMIVGGAGGLARAQEYGRMYIEVPVVSARRAVRFWKIREKTASAATSNAA